jgi:iron(III) transport system permease protein
VKRWRAAAVVGLLVAVGGPLAVPLLLWLARQERFLLLAGNTALLVSGTLALALPTGIAGAVLLHRTDLPLRHFFRFVTLLTLFVPLPVLTTAWQAALGSGGLLPVVWWLQGDDRPWVEGMLPAVWIHGVAALPWVILLVGYGLRWVESELEEDALLATGPWRVLWTVTLPRAAGVVLAAALWVTLQTAAEVAVTDMMQVRTAAEEVFAEFWFGGADAQARALATVLPLVALATGAVCWLWARLERVVPEPRALLRPPAEWVLGRLRWAALSLVLAGVAVLVGVPLAALAARTGERGWPPEWSAAAMLETLQIAAQRDGWLLGSSLATALLSGVLTAGVALVLCWLALDARPLRRLLILIGALLWCMPAPLLGVGLKEVILQLVVHLPVWPVSELLYSRPSPVPLVWAHLVRFLPCAVAALWPVVRMLPRDQQDALRLDGATPGQELGHLVVPALLRPWLAVVVVIAALAVGEVGAVAMRVETIGWETFARVLFDRMHYGLERDVTAPCLLLVLLIGAGGGLYALAVTLARRAPAAIRRLRRAPR